VGVSYGEVWWHNAQLIPDRTAIISGDDELTYADFDEAAARFAALLLDRGLGFGSPVAIVSYNRAEYMIALYGALKIGAILVPINFRYGGAEIASLLDDCGAEALVYVASLEPAVADAVSRLDRRVELLRIDDTDDAPELDAVPFEQWRTTPPVPSAAPPPGGDLYLFTGGTTGRPKAVVWPVDVLLEIQLFPIYTSVGLDIP
jgi:acyl-CoA synthetase (AMP-forming)/AMP-acid ligase II